MIVNVGVSRRANKKIMKEIHKWIIRTMQVEKLKMETTENLKSFGNIFKIQCTYHVHSFLVCIDSFGLVSGSYCLLIHWLFDREQMRAKKKKPSTKANRYEDWTLNVPCSHLNFWCKIKIALENRETLKRMRMVMNQEEDNCDKYERKKNYVFLYIENENQSQSNN